MTEADLGWQDGYNDAKNGHHCRFEEGHSEYAMSYYGGYCFFLNEVTQ